MRKKRVKGSSYQNKRMKINQGRVVIPPPPNKDTINLSLYQTSLSNLHNVYICVYICIYMFICTKLIEETGRPPGLIFSMWGYF